MADSRTASLRRPTPQSARFSPGHLPTSNPSAFVDYDSTRFPPSAASPPDNLPPAYPYCLSSHLTANSVTRTHSTSSMMDLQPMNAPQPSTSTHQDERSTYWGNSFAEQLAHRGPYPPAMNIPHPLHSGQHTLSHPATYSYRPTLRSPPDSQSYRAGQSSISILRPEYSNDQIYRSSIQNPQGLMLAISSSTGQSHHPHYQNQGMFSGSHNLSFSGNTFIDNSITSDSFMEKVLQHTIIGAEYDSSERNPPPRCHPETRLAILGRCKEFIVKCDGKEKMRWVVGPAGVGKSAIMQMVAEETPADASVFFSVNGRQDGTKTFMTIAYQLATKCEPYRQFLRNEITRDPALLQKLLPVQFKKFIVEPFIHQNLFDCSRRFVIIIDGLDECADPLTQRQLLELISEFCISYPTSPIVWFVASRPEPHITSFFDDVRFAQAYTKEEIKISSDEACEDVQRYLHDELNRIRLEYPTLKRKREWPTELEFTKIATATGGLFAYASTVVRYIGDPHYGDPVSQLDDVLATIDMGPKDGTVTNNNPLAQLDALYERILSNIPEGAMIKARKLLLVHTDSATFCNRNFRQQCNRLDLTEDAAYGAIRHLHAVVKVPAPDDADRESLQYFHKSFPDFLLDFSRSGFSGNAKEEIELLEAQVALRIVEQVPNIPNHMVHGGGIWCYNLGYLKHSPGVCDGISLSWPCDEHSEIADDRMRIELYRDSMEHICCRFDMDQSISYFHVMTTRFRSLGYLFPVVPVRDSIFDDFRYELMKLDKLKQVPIRALDYAAICGWITVKFMSFVGVQYSNPWNSDCTHQKNEADGSQQQQRGWTTGFQRALANMDIPQFNVKAGKLSHWKILGDSGRYGCLHCSERFARHFINNQDQLATVFVDSTEMSYVEFSFVDPGDGISEWTYRFFHSGSPSCTSGV